MTERGVPVKIWLTTDAALDNVAAIERVGGDAGLAARADALRARGWRANAEHPRRGLGTLGWPPEDEVLVFELSNSDLAFIRRVLLLSRLTTVEILESADLHIGVREEQLAALGLGDDALRYWQRLDQD